MAENIRPRMISVLENHPEHVRAIGMITIEVGNMELALCQLLGRTLGLGPDIAQAIYFTPRGAIARLDMMINVAKFALANDKLNLRHITNLLLRAKTIVGKRHNIIHDNWVQSPDGTSVMQMTMPWKEGVQNPKPVKLKTLIDLIDDIRRITTEALELVRTIPPAKLPPYPEIHVGPIPPGSP